MSKFNNLTKKVGKIKDSATNKSSEIIEATKANISISKEKDMIKKLYLEIGEKVYVNGSTKDVNVQEQIAKIKKHEANIAELELKIPKN
ncbi:MAG: hypothetical protein MJA31_01460 [Clostridia bacterium]|nr:hypothetical protein [Clostridia bacterium]